MFGFRYSIEFEMACPIIQHSTGTQRPIVYTLESGQVAETYFNIFAWDAAVQGYPPGAPSYWIAIGY